MGIKDYDSPGTASIVNATQSEVDNLDYDIRVVGTGLVNDVYIVRTAAPTLTQGTLTQYQLIDAENAPSSYERVFKTNGTASTFPTVTNDGLSESSLSDGSKKYSITTKTLPTAVSRPADPTPIKTITFTAPANITKGQSVSIRLSNFGYNNVYDCTTWADYHLASKVTSSVKSVRVYPVSTSNLVQYAIQPASKTNASVTEHTREMSITYKKLQVTQATSKTKTFLTKQEAS